MNQLINKCMYNPEYTFDLEYDYKLNWNFCQGQLTNSS